MLHLRISTPATLTEQVLKTLEGDSAVSSLAVLEGVSVRPAGDVVTADVAREGVNELVEQLRSLGVHQQGTIHVEAIPTWLSQAGFDAEVKTPGSSADAVVWTEVVQRSYEESELTGPT